MTLISTWRESKIGDYVVQRHIWKKGEKEREKERDGIREKKGGADGYREIERKRDRRLRCVVAYME